MDVSSISTSPTLALFVLLPIFIALTLLTTLAFTTLRYHLSRLTISKQPQKPHPPSFLPYTLPFLGHALAFLERRPGAFWVYLLTRRISRAVGSVTLLLGGRNVSVLFSPHAVQALFKSKNISRQSFNVQVVKGLGLSDEDCQKLYGTEPQDGKSLGRPGASAEHKQEDLNVEYLLTQSAVNELTSKFIETFCNQLAGQSEPWQETNLYAWIREHMFKASTVALLGTHIFEVYPNIADDYFVFDAEFLNMFFGLPKFLAPEGWRARDRLLVGITKWAEDGQEAYRRNGTHIDPSMTPWEPFYGARITQAREMLFQAAELSSRGRSSLTLGFLFGLASNAIPATGWMLLHILSPDADPTLLPRVLAEVKSTRLDDGSIDIPKLISLPLLQSLFQEMLRMYVDVLVTRSVTDSDLILPIDADGRQKILLKKDSVVMAPSWLGHRDQDAWGEQVPCDVFFPERFLRIDEKTGKEVFSLTGTNGKLFPFGGGRNICPGRVFAKQEVLASVAMILLGLDIEIDGYVDKAGKASTRFPGLKEGFVGNGIMAMDGDFKVRIRKSGG